MIKQAVEAIFEDGVFRVLAPREMAIREGQHVRLLVETEETSDDVLKFASSVYAGLSEGEIDEIEQIALDRRNFFGKNSDE